MRAVGFNPEAARYGGINVKRNYFLALAIAASFAGLAGGIDLLGWKFRLTSTEFDANFYGFTGIAVALLGRNKAVGILFAALLFGALHVGTLDPAARSGGLRPRARHEPRHDDPGARHRLRRRRVPHRLPLAAGKRIRVGRSAKPEPET